MYKHIVVPVDGSPLSEYAIPFALEIARRAGGRVRLLRAMPDPFLVAELPEAAHAGAKKVAQEHVDRLLRDWGDSEVTIVAEVRTGNPVDEILRADERADLVVMTTHGRGGIVAWVMGSVANKVIHLAATPVLVIHPPPTFTRAMAEASALRMFRDALIALDGSPRSLRSLAELRQFAEGGTRLHLVRVVPAGASPEVLGLAEADLIEVSAGLEARGASVVRAVLQNASPAGALADYAAHHGCGMIVMTTRGEGGLKRWLVGGTTDKVVRHGPTPVLVIRAVDAEAASGPRSVGA